MVYPWYRRLPIIRIMGHSCSITGQIMANPGITCESQFRLYAENRYKSTSESGIYTYIKLAFSDPIYLWLSHGIHLFITTHGCLSSVLIVSLQNRAVSTDKVARSWWYKACHTHEDVMPFCNTGPIWEGNWLVISGFPLEGASKMEPYDIFATNLYILLNKQWSCEWFETPWCSCDVTIIRFENPKVVRRNYTSIPFEVACLYHRTITHDIIGANRRVLGSYVRWCYMTLR